MPTHERSGPFSASCPTREILDQIGSKWSVLILIAVSGGPVRFNVLKRRIEGITQKVLGQALRRLERDGLVHRRAYPTVPVTVEYEITPLGRTLTPIVDGLRAWAVDNVEAVAAARARFEESATKIDPAPEEESFDEG